MHNTGTDKVKIAKCGKRTYSYCRKRWQTDDVCKSCSLIRRYTGAVDIDGKQMKVCSSCGRLLPLDDFYKNRINGKVYYYSKCRFCTSKTNNQRYHERSNKRS